MEGAHEQIADGWGALRAGDWRAAQKRFQLALQSTEDPDARDGLGQAHWWLNEIPAAHRERAAAYTAFRKRGELARAAGIAAWLAREQVFLHANSSAMNGWFARAERLLAQAGPCRERGWYVIWRGSMLDSPPELEQSAQVAIEIAQAFHDLDLEMTGLAFRGIALTGLGRVDEGLTCLDEAMAAATSGEVESLNAISEIFCVMLSACEAVGDLERTAHWCQIAAAYAREHHCAFLSAYCRTTYGGLLLASGRWTEAETELIAALRAFDAGHRGLRVHAAIKLADLRVQQGRLAEAAVLLGGYEDYGAATMPRARLHRAKGELNLARSVIEQALGTVGSAGVDRAPMLQLLVEILLDCGDLPAAHQAAQRLAELADQTQSDLLHAQAELTVGEVRRAAGGPDAADHLKASLARLRSYEQSLLAGRARLALARTIQLDDPPGAVAWARAALATFERLGAARDADEASRLLRDLGVAGGPGPRQSSKLTEREEEVLGLLADGLSNREIARRLYISPKTTEHHVSQILEKLGARSRAEAAAYAARRAR